MQPKQNVNEAPIVETNCQNKRLGDNLHEVFITDHNGIDLAFDKIKCKIRNEPGSFLTLIYSIQWLFPTPLYQSELELLERRFPSRLLTYYAFNCDMVSLGISEIDQQLLEIVINSNTSDYFHFHTIGQEELIESVTSRLLFLGIKSNQISSHIFK